MKIAQLAPLAESVPPKGYGGTELVVSQLTEELIRRGHEVVLFGTGDSVTSARLVGGAPHGLRADNVPPHRWCAYEMAAALNLVSNFNDFDIVHNHMGFITFPFVSQLKCPVVSTLHNPIVDYCAPVYLGYRHLPFVAISDAYRRLNYPDRLNYVGRVYNAVDQKAIAESTAANRSSKREGLLFIGRLSHAKGTAEAIKIAKSVGMPLKIAGKVDNNDKRYFDEQVKPHLKGDIEYVGEVDFEMKARLYREAKAVLYPIQFDEPFGLVMVEALASGTPLLALARGSVPELLEDKKNAVVASSVDELILRFEELFAITEDACIERARYFSIEKMADGYEEIYRSLLGMDEAPLSAKFNRSLSAMTGGVKAKGTTEEGN